MKRPTGIFPFALQNSMEQQKVLSVVPIVNSRHLQVNVEDDNSSSHATLELLQKKRGEKNREKGGKKARRNQKNTWYCNVPTLIGLFLSIVVGNLDESEMSLLSMLVALLHPHLFEIFKIWTYVDHI